MKRWTIRSFFLAVLLASLFAWWVSLSRIPYIGFGKSKVVATGFVRNALMVAFFDGPIHLSSGWKAGIDPAGDVPASNPYFLGFDLVRQPDRSYVRIPCWFLSGQFAFLLFIVWRKTRAGKNAHAFPVEVEK